MNTVNNVYLLFLLMLTSPLCTTSEESQVMKSTREPSVKNNNLEDNNMNENNMVHLENKNLIPLEDNNMVKNNMIHLEDTQDRRLLMMAVVGD